jgi:hypothetical protein
MSIEQVENGDLRSERNRRLRLNGIAYGSFWASAGGAVLTRLTNTPSQEMLDFYINRAHDTVFGTMAAMEQVPQNQTTFLLFLANIGVVLGSMALNSRRVKAINEQIGEQG